MNDECGDKIADNRRSINKSRNWLVDEGGVVDRVHKMDAQTVIYIFLKYFVYWLIKMA